MILLASLFGAAWRRWWGSPGPLPKWARTLVLLCIAALALHPLEWYAIPIAVALWVSLTAPHEDWQVWPREAAFKMLYTLPLAASLVIAVGWLGLLALPASFLASAAWPVFSKLAPQHYTEVAEYTYGAAIVGAVAWVCG